MKQKNFDYVPSGEFDYRDQSVKHSLSNHDYDLFKEEDDVVTKMVRVKRVTLPNKGENWKIFEDTKLVQTIEGIKLSAKERDFLRTVQGISFVVRYYKSGWKSFHNFRSSLKAEIK